MRDWEQIGKITPGDVGYEEVGKVVAGIMARCLDFVF